MRYFTKYKVWEISNELVLEIYQLTIQFPNSEKYNLISQIQRAVYSIPSNIAEGCGRDSDKNFNRFIHMELGSAHEVEYFLILTRDLKFITEEKSENLILKVNKTNALLPQSEINIKNIAKNLKHTAK